MAFRCPGQDRSFWRPDDIFEAPCPRCGAREEFWKDDPVRECQACGKVIPNPKLNMGCAEWCAHAEECLRAMMPGGRRTDADRPEKKESNHAGAEHRQD